MLGLGGEAFALRLLGQHLGKPFRVASVMMRAGL